MTEKHVNGRNGSDEQQAGVVAGQAPAQVDRREAARLMLRVAAATPIVALLFDPRSARAAEGSGLED